MINRSSDSRILHVIVQNILVVKIVKFYILVLVIIHAKTRVCKLKSLKLFIKTLLCLLIGICRSSYNDAQIGDGMKRMFMKPICTCPLDYEGEFCERKIYDPCEENPCQNNGENFFIFSLVFE